MATACYKALTRAMMVAEREKSKDLSFGYPIDVIMLLILIWFSKNLVAS